MARAKGAAVVQIYLTFETQTAMDKGERHYLLPSNDLAHSGTTYRDGYSQCTRLCESFRQAGAEVISKSRNKIH